MTGVQTCALPILGFQKDIIKGKILIGEYYSDQVGEEIIIQDCLLENSKDGQGIIAYQDKGKYINNIILNNRGTGIKVYGDDNQVALNVCRNNGNVILSGDCESNTDQPYIKDDAYSLNNSTWAQDTTEKYRGSASFRMTITAGGAQADARFCDNETTSDMHELKTGKPYKLSAWIYVPSAGGPALAEVKLHFEIGRASCRERV